jgi:hypothetical protein
MRGTSSPVALRTFTVSPRSILVQQPLNDQHVAPLTVELPVSAMKSDRQEATALNQANAGGVVGKELADQLVKAVAACHPGKRFRQRSADTSTAPLDSDVDAALADPGVARTAAVGGKSGPADDLLLCVRDQKRESAERGLVSKVDPRSDSAAL